MIIIINFCLHGNRTRLDLIFGLTPTDRGTGTVPTRDAAA